MRTWHTVLGCLAVLAGAAHADPSEPVEIHALRVDGQDVAAGPALDLHLGGGVDGPAQPGEIAVERAGGPLRGIRTPHPVDQLVNRDRAAGLDEQHPEHAALPSMPEDDRPAVDPGLHRAEHPELRRQQTSAHPSPRRFHQGIQEIYKERHQSPMLRTRSADDY